MSHFVKIGSYMYFEFKFPYLMNLAVTYPNELVLCEISDYPPLFCS